MVSQQVIGRVLEAALRHGGDFAEVYIEDACATGVGFIDGKLDEALSGRTHGAGVRIFDGTRSVYAYTNDTSLQALLQIAEQAGAALATNQKQVHEILLKVKVVSQAHPTLILPSSVAGQKKAELVKRAYHAAKAVSPLIVQVNAGYADSEKKLLIANSDGLYAQDERVYTRLRVSSVASDGKENQTGFEGPGRMMGFELFDALVDVEQSARDSAQTAVTMLHAPVCPAGRMPVIIENGFGGVIFHEACGHSLEATSVSRGASVFCGKLGQKIASEFVTAVDDATIQNAWGSFNIDDEGNEGRRTVLIENGILKNYMIDKLGSRRMEMPATGSGRRQSYAFAPTSRMSNTFILAGPHDEDEIIKSTPKGLYAKKMGGGSVNPVTGEFNFAVQEGYLIENGEIIQPVRGATLIGKGAEILLAIDRVGKNLELSQGVCGSQSGHVPTSVGQPRIRVSEMTVGGR